MTEQVCPLCQTAKHMRRTKLLYGTPVCERCYYRFAIMRQLAYIVDVIIWSPIGFGLPYGLELVLEDTTWTRRALPSSMSCSVGCCCR